MTAGEFTPKQGAEHTTVPENVGKAMRRWGGLFLQTTSYPAHSLVFI